MANGFGSLYVGSSGLQSAQNGLNVLANNLSNIDTDGYVRQRVIYADKEYAFFGNASVSSQRSGLGVGIGDVLHTRDVFLDQSYRSQNARQTFYSSLYDATSEVETFLQEMDGADFKEALSDLYSAFAEYAKDPSDSANQNLVVQKSELFISRAQSVYNGLKEYQSTVNTKITNDVNRINEIGERIVELNKTIQSIEAGNVETAMDARDERDALLDELSGLCRISYTENNDGIVKVRIEGQEFITEKSYSEIGLYKDQVTDFVTPYWVSLSEPEKENYYNVFVLEDVCAENSNDLGEVKALLLARGETYGTYMNMMDAYGNFTMSSDTYDSTLANSVMINAQSEMDILVHGIVTAVNDLLSPTTTAGEAYSDFQDANGNIALYDAAGNAILDNLGNQVYLSADARVADTTNCSVGSDGEIPPRELFVRSGADRYTTYYMDNGDGTYTPVYVYNEEDPTDQATCYTTHSLSINEELVTNQSLLAYKTQNGAINYDLSEQISELWDANLLQLNPSDTTPTTFEGFYTKYVGELGTNGSIFKATTESMQTTVDSIESNRQAVIGVSSDEELTNMIKYQNAYNASSRYITVISEMIETLISAVG